jgi:hypothetical protein
LTAPTASAAASTRAAAGFLITRKGHPEDDSHDHQAQQHNRGDEEEMAFDHAWALWRRKEPT